LHVVIIPERGSVLKLYLLLLPYFKGFSACISGLPRLLLLAQILAAVLRLELNRPFWGRIINNYPPLLQLYLKAFYCVDIFTLIPLIEENTDQQAADS
jgi:hypothetical protein